MNTPNIRAAVIMLMLVVMIAFSLSFVAQFGAGGMDETTAALLEELDENYPVVKYVYAGVLAAVSLCCVVFAALIRERVYLGRPRKNWVGTLNAFSAGSIAGAVVSFIPHALFTDGGAIPWYYMLGAPVIGLAAGLWAAASARVRAEFQENTVLYYGSTVIISVSPVFFYVAVAFEI
ncbi:MAG: hypothetical protein FWB85_06815 [Chitinispirillia bacterium]|nr:hypothetical protein [Chitinispirillia bacterium]MCL2241946.1 hypothetical protein [Chitinispirillia bacterium]